MLASASKRAPFPWASAYRSFLPSLGRNPRRLRVRPAGRSQPAFRFARSLREERPKSRAESLSLLSRYPLAAGAGIRSVPAFGFTGAPPSLSEGGSGRLTLPHVTQVAPPIS